MAALTAAAIVSAVAALGSATYQAVSANQANQDAKGRAGQIPEPPKPPKLARQTALGQAAATAAGDDLRKRAAATPGRRSTLLTGSQGTPYTTPPAGRKTLMGV